MSPEWVLVYEAPNIVHSCDSIVFDIVISDLSLSWLVALNMLRLVLIPLNLNLNIESEYSWIWILNLVLDWEQRGPLFPVMWVPYSYSFPQVSRCVESLVMEMVLSSPSDHQDSDIVLTHRDPLKTSLSNVKVIWLWHLSSQWSPGLIGLMC